MSRNEAKIKGAVVFFSFYRTLNSAFPTETWRKPATDLSPGVPHEEGPVPKQVLVACVRLCTVEKDQVQILRPKGAPPPAMPERAAEMKADSASPARVFNHSDRQAALTASISRQRRARACLTTGRGEFAPSCCCMTALKLQAVLAAAGSSQLETAAGRINRDVLLI